MARCAMQHALAYREDNQRPPRPGATVQSLRAAFDTGIPEQGRDPVDVIEALVAAATPGLVGTIRPGFFAWVMGASHPVGVAAEWLVTAWGQNAGIYNTAPSAAVVEDVVAAWLLDLLDLPAESSVGFCTGATMASSVCLAAARHQVLRQAGYDLAQGGVFAAPEIKIFLGEEAHSTIFSGLRYLGFGEDNLVRIEADGQGQMRAESLATALADWSGPAIVICQAGHIHTGGFDPLQEVITICRSAGAWCHVDGAFGLWARSVPELRPLCEGVDGADSWSVDGHKWLQVPYDSGFAIVRHREAHQRAMGISAGYLAESPGNARSPSQYCPELSRRARGFAVWAIIQALGREGITEMVARHCRCARELGRLLSGEPGIRVLNEVVLNQVAITFGEDRGTAESNRLTDAVIEQLARDNRAFVEGADWNGRKILRVSVISRQTDREDIEHLGRSIIDAWRRVATKPPP